MVELVLTPQEGRRLAIVAQRLEAPQPAPTKADILDTIRQITCLQLDPINVVARTQLLVLFSRLGQYNVADLESLLWEDKALFEYWAHAASIVLADDFALFRPQMVHREPGKSLWRQRGHDFWAANEGFRGRILDELAGRGPLFADEITSQADVNWAYDNSWGGGKDIRIILDMMWGRGYVTVTGREGAGYGLKKQWGLMTHQLGDRIHEPPEERPVLVRRAAERALLALGPARLRDVKQYFTRFEYPGLAHVLNVLEKESIIDRVRIAGDDGDWPGVWYLHRDLWPEVERIRRGEWRPQTVLLSPFDNLIADRDRTHLLFDFLYRIEIYTPPAKRQYGYYVMPILHGDRLIGRIDPRMDRKEGRLVVNAVHLEPGVTLDGATRPAVRAAIESLAAFLDAQAVDISL